MQKFRRMHIVAGVTLALFSTMTIASMGDTAEAAEELVPLTDAASESSLVATEDVDALAWMENEMQMSIDPTNAPQGVTAGWSCTRPPFNCPTYQKCPGSLCKINECGEGKCSFCPVNPPFRIVNSWCTYICMKGPAVVGGAYGFRLAFDLWYGPTCF